MLLKQSFILLFLSVLVACAGASKENYSHSGLRSDCIHQPSIRGYRILDEQNLIVDAAARKSYHVRLQRRAYGLRGSWGIGFSARTNRICAGFSDVVFDGYTDADSIRIASIRELTPAEEEGLLIQFGLKEPEIKHVPVPQEVEGADIEELDPDAVD